MQNFPGGTVESAHQCRDTGLIPGLGRFHSQGAARPHGPQLLKSTAATMEAHTPRACELQQRRPHNEKPHTR